MGEEGPRRRKFKPKTRTGCVTCRIRRIKCDEAKPACLKCTSTGRKCDGYTASSLSRTSKSPPPSTPPLPNSTTVAKAIIPRIASTPFEGTKTELRAFRYFQHETVPQICGFYRDQFWLHSVLQACHHDPAIRHAAIALGSLHEQSAIVEPPFPAGVGGLVTGNFALQQYNKAIQALLKPVLGKFRKPEQKVDVALITCVLFACFDALRGHLGTVFDHIDGGVKILSEHHKNLSLSGTDQESKNLSHFVPISTLNTLFTRLDIQGSALISTRRLYLQRPSHLGPSIENLSIPSIFRTIEEARESQDAIFRCWHVDYRRTLTNGAELPHNDIPDAEEYSYLKTTYNNRLSQWDTAYNSFLNRRPEKECLPADHALRLLKVYIWIHVNIDPKATLEDETSWDVYAPQFREIVHHAGKVIDSTSSQSRKRILFSLDTLLISPLYLTASRCRHPVVRREAIQCLIKANRQEGLWDSRTLARAAQRVMEIEEEGLGGTIVDGSEIPGWKRIFGVHPTLDEDGRRAVIHYTSKPVEEGGLPFTDIKELIEW